MGIEQYGEQLGQSRSVAESEQKGVFATKLEADVKWSSQVEIRLREIERWIAEHDRKESHASDQTSPTDP